MSRYHGREGAVAHCLRDTAMREVVSILFNHLQSRSEKDVIGTKHRQPLARQAHTQPESTYERAHA
eukprot:4296536-Pleurochrysis_carterae.AAC.1